MGDRLSDDCTEPEELVYAYTSADAVEDGVLFDITQINPEWEKGLIRFITTNLLSRGYIQDGEVNIPNVLDLLNQALSIVREGSKNFSERPDTFYCGKIELPNGESQEIFIELNELDRYTILLPEDH